LKGGKVIAEGTPEQVARARGSATGEYLARILRGEPLVPLSDVTFAEEAGRTNGHDRRPTRQRATVTRKRAAAAT
jgi:hypothetical protein